MINFDCLSVCSRVLPAGCHGHVLPQDEGKSSWETSVDQVKDYITDLNSKVDDTIKRIRSSKLNRELEWVLNKEREHSLYHLSEKQNLHKEADMEEAMRSTFYTLMQHACVGHSYADTHDWCQLSPSVNKCSSTLYIHKYYKKQLHIFLSPVLYSQTLWQS